MKRRTLLLATAAGGAALPFAHGRTAEEVIVGDINSYTRMAAFTEPYRKGLELATEEINEAGGAAGKQIRLVIRDDAGEPGEAVKIAEELLARERAAFITGGFFSNVGLALASWARQRRTLYIAGEPLADALVWQSGNRYTFRLRPSTWMQAAMLAEEAAKQPAVRWAAIAPNYAYGKEAVTAFKEVMGRARPDIEWVAEQWPPLFSIDAGAEIQALLRARPEAIFNVTFGTDMARLVREGTDRGFFADRFVVGLLNGEPEYLDPVGPDTPEGWLVTGYPWSKVDTPAHLAFVAAYRARWDDYPRMGSLVGYNLGLTIGALIEATGGETEGEQLVDAMSGLGFETPLGPIHYRPSDHQSTMGTFVGYTTLENGQGTMRDWYYADGADYLPSPEEVAKLRPAD
jgi:branched-chain amino acid transport system substrate-binding protein